MAEWSVTRRRLLLATGWTAAGVTVLYLGGRRLLSAAGTFAFPGAEDAAAWLQIGPDGRCRMLCPRAEMGQNASSALAQIVAEELGLVAEAIELRWPTTLEMAPVGLTAGSMSMRFYAEPVARAAAALRELLRRRAAERAGLDVVSVGDAAGGFRLPDGARVDYAELAGGKAIVLEADDLPEASLYTFDPQRRHAQVGRPVTPHDFGAIVTGRPLFASDVRLPDMLFGRMARPPTRWARLVGLRERAARAIPGVVEVVVNREHDRVGVVAETPSGVSRGIQALAAEWASQEPFDQRTIDALLDVDDALAQGALEHAPQDDRFEDDLVWDVDLRFEIQLQSHAMQEPRAALARFGAGPDAGRLEIWTGSQDPYAIQRHAAAHFDLDPDRVVVHPCRMGGGFGGREQLDVERDAGELAAAVGRPVKVQWTREDEFHAAMQRPASSHRVRLAASSEGRLVDWWHAFVSGHIVFARERLPDWLRSPLRLIGDLGVARGSHPPYAADRMRIEYGDVDLPVGLGSWRSLGAAPNTFAIESAIDELARARGLDPVELRLANMPVGHERLAACLRRVRSLAERVEPSHETGFGRGFACGIYEENSFVAASADVRVESASGAIRVLRMCCVQDVGLAINPDQLRAQIEGNLVWGLGMALHERVEIGESAIASSNFDRYAIPRLSDAPELEIELIAPRDVAPAGAGETALIVAAPAIANALRDATGRRFTTLPIRSVS